MKVVPQASNCMEIEAGGRTYRRKKDGLFDMPEHVAKHVIKYEGGQTPSLSGTRHAGGFYCRPCNFAPFFKTCSRCGQEAERA